MVAKKYIFLFLTTAALLIISGCNDSSSSGGITDADVRKGTEGLLMEFNKNAPPEKIFEETIFPISIKLNNKGASDIENGFLALGFERAYANLEDDEEGPLPFDIKGKSIFDLNGDENYITLNGITKKIGAQSETHPSTILATACYQYQTVLGTSVCVDTDIFGTATREKSCEVKDRDFGQGQGAPVAITKIETRMLPDQDNEKVKPHFIIHVENKGNGEVISQNKVQDACTKNPLGFNDFNRIIVRAFLSNEQLTCDAEGNLIGGVRLRDKKDIVRCTLEEGIDRAQDAFTSPLRIELDYGYTFTISKDITIEKILKY